MEACLLGIVFVNIDLPKLAAPTNLDGACTGVDKPLFTFSVAFLDDPVEVIQGVRLILNRQGSGPLIGGQAGIGARTWKAMREPPPARGRGGQE